MRNNNYFIYEVDRNIEIIGWYYPLLYLSRTEYIFIYF